MHHPIFIKAGVAKIFKIADKTTCMVNNKLSMCFDDSLGIQPEQMPSKYSVKFNISYDLNQLADQDGNVEEDCTKAFVKQISTTESYSYLECAEPYIDFDNLLKNILNEVILSSLTTTRTTVENSITVVTDFFNSPNLIVNEKILNYIDENSGIKRITKQISRKLFQSSIVSLKNTGYILDSLSVESDKSESFGTLTLDISATTIDPIIQVDNENPANINLDMLTDCS